MSRPSTLSPEGKETDTVAVAALVVAAVMRRLRAPPVTQVVCSVLGSGILAAIPFRSPVGEWQLLHFVAKYAWPALGAWTAEAGGVVPGGDPCAITGVMAAIVTPTTRAATQQFLACIPSPQSRDVTTSEWF